jgi:hypothetical protein
MRGVSRDFVGSMGLSRGGWMLIILTHSAIGSSYLSAILYLGGEIVNEFLVSTGYLPGAHTPDCPVYEIVLSLKPAWNSDSIMEN